MLGRFLSPLRGVRGLSGGDSRGSRFDVLRGLKSVPQDTIFGCNEILTFNFKGYVYNDSYGKYRNMQCNKRSN